MYIIIYLVHRFFLSLKTAWARRGERTGPRRRSGGVRRDRRFLAWTWGDLLVSSRAGCTSTRFGMLESRAETSYSSV